MKDRSRTRLWELDVIRFMALAFMLTQHLVIIWTFMRSYQFAEYPEIIDTIGRLGALLFLFLVGVSGFISYSYRSVNTHFLQLQRYYLVRGAKILGWAMLISLVSFLVIPLKPIWYGVLHFIGTAVITLPFFVKYKWLSRVMIPVGLVVGTWFMMTNSESYIWLPLGIQPRPFLSLDYWPYFPWISLVLTGVEAARVLFSSKIATNTLFSASMPTVLRPIQWLGCHTLHIYLIHAPITVLIVWLLQRGLGL